MMEKISVLLLIGCVFWVSFQIMNAVSYLIGLILDVLVIWFKAFIKWWNKKYATIITDQPDFFNVGESIKISGEENIDYKIINIDKNKMTVRKNN